MVHIIDRHRLVINFSEATIQKAMAHLEEHADDIARHAEARGCGVDTIKRELLHSYIFDAPSHAHAQALHELIEARRMKEEKAMVSEIKAFTDNTSAIAMRFVDSTVIKNFEVPPTDPRIQGNMEEIALEEDSVENLRGKLEDAYASFLKVFEKEIKAEELKKGPTSEKSIFDQTTIYTYLQKSNGDHMGEHIKISARTAKTILGMGRKSGDLFIKGFIDGPFTK